MMRKMMQWRKLSLLVVFLSMFMLLSVSNASAAKDVELYGFVGGYIDLVKAGLVKAGTPDEKVKIPIPFFVIKHGKDYVVFDAGMSPTVATDPVAAWGEKLTGWYKPIMKPEEALSSQLKTKLKLEPKNIKAIILSHGHLDHAGDLQAFKGVPVYVQKTEYDTIQKALDPTAGVLGYIVPDLKDANYKVINGVVDFFGDGTVIIVPLTGHTMGLQGAIVKTAKKTFALVSDAVNFEEQLDKTIELNGPKDPALALQELYIAQMLRLMGLEVVPMHDPDYWAKRTLAPKQLQ